jgi:hypothetical protein
LAGSTAPDSIEVVGNSVWVAYGNNGNPDGSNGAKSQIVEYSSAGKVKLNLTVTGHNDGLRLNPANTIYAVTTPLAAGRRLLGRRGGAGHHDDAGQLDLTSGAVVPGVTNLVSPHGMAFVGF